MVPKCKYLDCVRVASYRVKESRRCHQRPWGCLGWKEGLRAPSRGHDPVWGGDKVKLTGDGKWVMKSIVVTYHLCFREIMFLVANFYNYSPFKGNSSFCLSLLSVWN